MDKSHYWFKRPSLNGYGYGSVSVTWQGWTVIAGYVIVVVALVPAFLDAPEAVASKEAGFFVMLVTAATAGLLLISFSNGPRARWRWGARTSRR